MRSLVVSSISPNSAAELSGVRIGDEVLRLGGFVGGHWIAEQSVSELEPEHLRALLAGLRSDEWGQELSLQVRTADEEIRSVSLWPHLPQPLLSARLIRPAEVGEGGFSFGGFVPAGFAPWETKSIIGLGGRQPGGFKPDAAAEGSGASKADDCVGYMRLTSFSESGTAELVRVVRALESQRCRGYVIDLRNNPGGQLLEAMVDASMLLGQRDAVVAYTLDAAGVVTKHTVASVLGSSPAAAASPAATPSSREAVAIESAAHDDAGDAPTLLQSSKPLVLLVDRGTASSAEMFAAALHDNGAALVLGEATYGKGLVQRVFPLPNGAALKLTIGEYFRPTQERVVRGGGIRPDVSCTAVPTAGANDACIRQATRLVFTAADHKP